MITLALITFIICLVVLWMYYLQPNNIPGPTRIPFIGCVRLLTTKPSEIIYLLRDYKEIYGDAYIIYLFNNPYVILSHPKYAMPLLLNTKNTTKGRSYAHFVDWLGDGLLTSFGVKWKTFRKLLTPAFHFNVLQETLQTFLKNEKAFIEIFKEYADGRPFDLVPIIALMTLDNVMSSIMGVQVNAQSEFGSKYVKCLKELTRIIAFKIQNPIAGNKTLFSFMPDKIIYDRSLKFLQDTTMNVIKLRRQALDDQNITRLVNGPDTGLRNKNAFLDLMLLSEINGSKIDDKTIREQVESFMFGGHDTITSGMVFALFCLSRHEDVQQKIFDEQKEILSGDLTRDPLFVELQQMKYLEMVIKETLRLYPSAPMVERLNTRDIEIGGIHIKKNTSIVVNILEIHRHPELFEDPLEFRPERFDMSKQTDKNINNHFLAFSAGSRNCIGQKFAMLELKVMVASVVKHFKLLPVDEEPKLSMEVVLRSQNGVKIRLEPREVKIVV